MQASKPGSICVLTSERTKVFTKNVQLTTETAFFAKTLL
jgi:hypothetical protein